MVLSNKGSLIGVDLGGTKVAAGRIDNNVLGTVLNKPIPAKSENPDDITKAIIKIIEELMTEEVVGIGIGIPGLVDRESGIVNDVQNIPSWQEIRLKEMLEDRFEIPVFLDNDANCYALGEARFGSGMGEEDFVGLTLGTGMGAGIIKNGFLLQDAHCGSGEFGNILYLNSVYEDYCSGKFFTKFYNTKGEELAEAANHQDPMALKAFDEFGKHLGNAIKTIKFAVDPKKVIIGGSVAQAHRHYETSMWKTLLDFPLPKAMEDFDVIFSNVKNIAVLGAASLYLDRTKTKQKEKEAMAN